MVTLSTKLSHAYNDHASHAYEDDSKNTTSANKERPHHQDPDSDEDVIALLSTHGNNKMQPFYPLLRGRSEDAPSVTNDPKSNIMELQLATDDDQKNVPQFRLSFETLIEQNHHYSLLFCVQNLHNKIPLLNIISISGYHDYSLATTVYIISQ